MSHTLQGVIVGPVTQFRHLAKIRAIDVLPTPRVPENKYAYVTAVRW